MLPMAWAAVVLPLLRNALPEAAPVGVTLKATVVAVAVTAAPLDWTLEMALDGMPALQVAMVRVLVAVLPKATADAVLLASETDEFSADPDAPVPDPESPAAYVTLLAFAPTVPVFV